MKIVADRDIFAVERIFRPLGELVLLPGRSIGRDDLRGADALLVRSVSRVNRELLEGSTVQFVATATSGTDHIDLRWLRQAGIALAHARGANATAVVEYCLGALASLVLSGSFDPAGGRIGIVGAGAIGGRLARRLQSLGHEVVVCDPPLAEAATQAEFDYQPLAAALDCELVSLHVPLTDFGNHPTAGLLDAAAIARLRPGTAILQTSRGGVIDERALLARLAERGDLHCMIDVWENEPWVNPELVAKASLATAHIAGYSEQAKLAATMLLAKQLTKHFDLPEPAPWQAAQADKTGKTAASVTIAPDGAGSLGHWQVPRQCLAIEQRSAHFKRWICAQCQAPERNLIADEFDRLRKPALQRQQFAATSVFGIEHLTEEQRAWLRKLGFRLLATR